MLKKKCMVGVLLAILGLTALMMIPIGSSPSTREYDPWLDYNDDGRIDMRDIGSTCMHFGTVGDPAKPVIINHNWKEGNFSFNLGSLKDFKITVSTGGFKTLTLYIKAFSVDEHKFQVYLGSIINGEKADERVLVIKSQTPFVILITPPPEPWGYTFPANFKETYSVGFSELIVWIWNNSTSYNLWGNVYYYLTT